MSYAPEGEVFTARLEITGPSSAAPPGKYISLGIGCGDASTRAFLSPAQSLALGRWLRRPKAKKPGDRVQSPTRFPVAGIDPKPSRSQDASRPHEVPSSKEGELVATASHSGDHLVSALFVTGTRERLAATSTADLEHELATFEPFLTRMAKRLIRGVVAGHVRAKECHEDELAEACYRETLILLLAFRGASSDLWYGVYGDDADRGRSS